MEEILSTFLLQLFSLVKILALNTGLLTSHPVFKLSETARF